MYSSEEVNLLHLNSDKDAGSGALHHTLGQNPSQASPGNHTHNGKDSKRINTGSLTTVAVPYSPVFSGTGLVFTGTPATGTYIRIGNLVHFRITVRCTTVTNFGSGQYHLTLPFAPVDHYVFRDGGLHSGSNHYIVMGDAEDGSLDLRMLTAAANGADAPLTHNNPKNFATTDYFYVSGTYEAAA
jgi:hypothetical protein